MYFMLFPVFTKLCASHGTEFYTLYLCRHYYVYMEGEVDLYHNLPKIELHYILHFEQTP